MPLPSALRERLKKRGLLSNDEDENREEIFAESYDDPNDTSESKKESNRLVYQTPKCPNKINPYHDCTDYCFKKFGPKKFMSASLNMDRKRKKMLQKYPLAPPWKEVADPDTGRFFYWNTDNDQVSWLPPTHPRAKIGLCVTYLRQIGKWPVVKRRRVQYSDHSSSESSIDSEDERRRHRKRRHRDRDRSHRDRDRDRDRDRRYDEKSSRRSSRHEPHDHRSKRSEKKGSDLLDPMDPAAYSDIPRGSWSTGLNKIEEAKAGVDDSVTGTAFQARPYPSPGDVLRVNKASNEEEPTKKLEEQVGVAAYPASEPEAKETDNTVSESPENQLE